MNAVQASEFGWEGEGAFALVRRAGRLALERRPPPRPGPGEVVLRAAFAGLCRTDLRVADGEVAVVDGRVLGHEVAGVVAAVGAGVEGLAVGDPAAVDPRLPCGRCPVCMSQGTGLGCQDPSFLGVDRDGAFAGHVAVPAAAIVPVPAGMDLRLAAYVEPVAATLAIVEAGLPRAGVGVVAGRGRIAELALLVLRVHGFERVTRVDPEALGGAADLDFAIEAAADGALVPALLARLRPRGTLVVKSRALGRVAIDLGQVVAREARIVGASYGSFAEAARLLASGRLDPTPLFGPARALSEHAAVFAEARAGEAQKLFFDLR